jgi:hypothetical protein
MKTYLPSYKTEKNRKNAETNNSGGKAVFLLSKAIKGEQKWKKCSKRVSCRFFILFLV